MNTALWYKSGLLEDIFNVKNDSEKGTKFCAGNISRIVDEFDGKLKHFNVVNLIMLLL